MIIEVVKDITPLEKKVFRFFFLEKNSSLVLDSYSLKLRESRRHKYKEVLAYHRLNSRFSTLKADDIVLSEEIKTEALKVFIDKIKVEK